MVEKHGLQAFGVDPTAKHSSQLKGLEKATDGKFHYLQLAVTKDSGTVTFHESQEHESGSVLLEHTNVRNDTLSTYEVKSVSMPDLVAETGVKNIGLLKLDIEGAEYELLGAVSKEDLEAFEQIFIEFHHHCTVHTKSETKQLVQRICMMGFTSFTVDGDNYIFCKIHQS
jgi:FkbM family methyltransferase